MKQENYMNSNRFKKILFLLTNFPNLSLALSVSHASFIDNTREKVRLIWNKKGCLQAEENVFITSFYETYKNIPLNKLEVKDLFEFLQETFNNERKTLIGDDKKEVNWISAVKYKDYVVGYLSFEFDKKSKHIYIRQLAIDPNQMQRGIAKYLIFSIKNKYPAAKKIVINLLKLNLNAFNFYKKLGFEKSNYMHTQYNPKLYHGLELNLNDTL